MNDSDYLQNVHVTRLQAAARMAGLRWKNGDPGTDKAGIIARLLQHPSILRATVATLQRMEKGEPQPARKPVTFSEDDFSDDTLTDATTEEPAQHHPDFKEVKTSTTLPGVDLSQYVRKSEHATDMAKLAGGLRTRLDDGIEIIRTETREALESLKARRPVQFVFPSGKQTTIDPTEHHESFPKLVKYLQTNRRCILTGSAGTGKSLAAKNAAEALEVPFYLMTPVTMSHELIGHRDAQGVFHETPLFKAYTRGGLVLLDEMDASFADAMLVANPILDGNGWAPFGDGELHAQHAGFLAIANMNTDGFGATMQYPGRTRLDGATIARFGCRIHWAIDARIETMMAGGQRDWHLVIVAVRDYMVSRDIVDVNATPRHLKTGAALLNANCATRREILEDCLKNGAVVQSWPDVLRLPAVAQFLKGQA